MSCVRGSVKITTVRETAPGSIDLGQIMIIPPIAASIMEEFPLHRTWL
jgi:hypothetical protein